MGREAVARFTSLLAGCVLYRSAIALALLALAGVAARAQAPFIRSETYTQWWLEPWAGVLDELYFPQAQLPVFVDAKRHDDHGGFQSYGTATRQTGFKGASARSTVFHPGLDKNYAYVGSTGVPGGAEPEIRASAHSTMYAKYVAFGPTGLTVPVDLNYFLNGWIFSGRVPAQQDNIVDGYVSVRMTINAAQETEILFAYGKATVFGLDSGLTANNGWSSSGWNNSWSDTSGTITSPVGFDLMFDLNYTEVIPDIIEVPTNTPFYLKYEMVTEATIGDSRSGTYYAASNFANSGQAYLTCNTPGINLQEVDLTPNIISPSVETIERGGSISGNLASYTSDDTDRRIFKPGSVLVSTQRPVSVVLTGTLPFATPSALKIQFTSHSQLPNINEQVEMWRYSTSQWVTVRNATAAVTNDATYTLTPPTAISQYIGPGNEVKMRYSYKPNSAVLVFPWQVRVNRAVWQLTY